jgi:hypothetical protein
VSKNANINNKIEESEERENKGGETEKNERRKEGEENYISTINFTKLMSIIR